MKWDTPKSMELRHAIWDEMLTSDYFFRYFSYLAQRSSSNNLKLKIFLAISSSSVVLSWGFIPNIDLLWKILSGVSALVAVATPIINLDGNVSTLVELRTRWYETMKDHEKLWYRINTQSDSRKEMHKEFDNLVSNQAPLIRMASEIKGNKKLDKRFRDEVIQARLGNDQ